MLGLSESRKYVNGSRKYFEVMKITLVSNLVYFWSFVLRNGFFLVIMFVYLMLWRNIYAAKGSTIAGFSIGAMIWYMVVTEIITLSRPNVHAEIAKDVKQGSIAYLLNKPYHYVLYNLALFLGEFGLRFVVNGLVGIGIGLAFVGALSGFNLAHLPWIVLSILAGCLLNFAIFTNLALTAFWIEENQAFFWIYSKLVFTLGGMLMPLELFPGWLQAISRHLPFAYVTYVPGKLAVDFSWSAFLTHFPVQLGYIGLFMCTAFILYGKGAKQLNVNGG